MHVAVQQVQGVIGHPSVGLATPVAPGTTPVGETACETPDTPVFPLTSPCTPGPLFGVLSVLSSVTHLQGTVSPQRAPQNLSNPRFMVVDSERLT